MYSYFRLSIVVLAALAFQACSLEQATDPCTKDERKCEGNIFYECLLDGETWDRVDCGSKGKFCSVKNECVGCNEDENCQSAEKQCVEHACQPLSVIPCVEASTKCKGGKATTCLKKAWENEEICANGCNAEGSACQPAGDCAPNSMKCDKDTLMSCSSDGVWLLSKDCAIDSKFCDAGKGCIECKTKEHCKNPKPICNADTNTCQAADVVCGVDETKCEGNTFRKCNATQSGYDETLCENAAPLCDENGCVECRDINDCPLDKPVCNATTNTCQAAAPVCAKDETKCDGSTYKKCNAMLSGFDVTVCVTPTAQCLEAKGCVQCRDKNDCPTEAPVCHVATNTCEAAAAVCAKGETKCDGNTHKKCNIAQTGFDLTTCATPTPLCVEAKGCVECKINTDCKDPLKTICNTTKNICEAAIVCAVGETKCDGNTQKKCNATQTGFDLTTCATPTPLCVETKGCVACKINTDCKDPLKTICNTTKNICEAAVCAKGETKCDGNTQKKCNATQTGFDLTVCATPTPLCVEAKGCVACKINTDCKDPLKTICNQISNTCEAAVVCAIGDTKCEGGVFKKCNATRTGFNETVCGKTSPICDTTKGCIQCRDEIDCTDGIKTICNRSTNLCEALVLACKNGATRCENKGTFSTCYDGNWSSVSCRTELVCDDTRGCVECTTNTQCPKAKPVCNSKTNICEAKAFACINGQTKCELDGSFSTCSGGAWMSISCAAGRHCNALKGCVHCSQNNDCVKGYVCNPTTNACDSLSLRCVEGQKACMDEITFTTCSGGRWSSVSCATGYTCNNDNGCVPSIEWPLP